MRIKIDKQGVLHMIYTDSLDVRGMGESTIRRVGNVEPTSNSDWEVVVGGESLGRYPLREEALRVEVERVEEKYL